MSYSLGQAKWVPGQISFASLPQGRTGLPSVQPLLEAGLPVAPYIEHGSFETGEPSIMRYGLDPYRGIMGLGCFFSRSAPATPPAAAPTMLPSSANLSDRIAQAYASNPGARAVGASMSGRGVVESGGSTVFDGDFMSALAFAADYSRRNRVASTVRVTGSPRGDGTFRFDAAGQMSRERPRAGMRGLGQDGGAAEPVKMNFELVLEGEPRGEYLYAELAEAADALAMAVSRTGKAGTGVSPPGSDTAVADVAPGRGTVRMLHGLGQTLGQSLRRLEDQDYVMLCDSWARTALGGGRRVRGMRAVMLQGKALLRRNRRDVCRVFIATPAGRGEEIVTLRLLPNGQSDVRFNYALAGMGANGMGMGDLLTEYACSGSALATAWTNRQRAAVNASRVAAVISGVAVGGIAAAVSENSVPLGAIGGGITSFLINALWMGPHTL